jgi:hypothetical protein
MLNWESLFVPSRLSTHQITKLSVGVNPHGRSTEKMTLLLSDSHLEAPVPGTPNIEVVYDTSPGTITRAAHGGPLMEGLRLSTLKQDRHGGLRGSGHRSVIPYIHGEDCCIVVLLCVVLFKHRVELL